jgi:Asp-tRNA(Asn)/Glu-tRNA(Gln) amidotransferase A subunit family amidase
MSEDDLAWMTATEAAGRIRDRELSPVEYVTALLERTERVDAQLCSYLSVAGGAALAAAHVAEEAVARRDDLGPLHGVPISVKDNLWVQGTPTTCGSLLFRDFEAPEDAEVVQRAKRAGAIVIGKTHMPEGAAFPRTVNRLAPECVNPWSRAHVSGASSGGAAAGVGAGLVPLAIGTDGGGSTRIPAALCGVFGLQPSAGLVPAQGRLGSVRYSGIGPIARDVRDAALLLSVMAGRDHMGDLDGGVDGLSIGWSADLGFVDVDQDVGDAVADAVRALERLGAKVADADAHVADPWEAFVTLNVGAHVHEGTPAPFSAMPEVVAAAHDPEGQQLLTPYILAAVLHGEAPDRVAFERAQSARATLCAHMAELFASHDLLATPTMAVVAPPAPEDPWANPFTSTALYTGLTSLVNLAGTTAATVPCGFVNGLPVGLQLLGPAGSEALVLRASHAFERARPWAQDRPPR